ncbi:hypothetical protein BST61_g1420 [Cercospora zeina]
MAKAKEFPPARGTVSDRALRPRKHAAGLHINTNTAREKIVLKIIKPSTKTRTKYTRPGPNEQGDYQVEDILDAWYDGLTKAKSSRWQYLVQWTGYPKNEAQWLPQSEIGDWWIEEYWRTQNMQFVSGKAEAMEEAENYLTAVEAAAKWTRDSERNAFWDWMARREKAAERAEKRARSKRRRYR